MKSIFDSVSAKCSKVVTKAYSTSFSLGISFLDRKFHHPIYAIYGYVRFADEIVDSFHDYDKVKLIQKFREDTVEALNAHISLNPILNSFQEVVHRYHIEWELIDSFLLSMEMDLSQKDHCKVSYEQYIFGSAEVVGLMCLRVFTESDDHLYSKLKPFAMKLGAAFQKINFLRDLKADYEGLGRTYFPTVNFSRFSAEEKMGVQREIEQDFKQALIGIKMLPVSSRRGVYLAYYYYSKLFNKIKSTPAEKIITTRIRIPDLEKMVLLCQSFLRFKAGVL
ncbi:MAG TPA: phytoene/squalene synthase family protein [Cytophagales bacterium]|nr:phytoene/squalene synthase family protein [Cytophagales bacterium]